MSCFKSVVSTQIVPILTLIKPLYNKFSFEVLSSGYKLLILGGYVRTLIGFNMSTSSWYIISNIIAT